MLTINAAIARPLSKPLTDAALGGAAGAFGFGGVGAGVVVVAGRVTPVAGAAVGGRGAVGAGRAPGAAPAAGGVLTAGAAAGAAGAAGDWVGAAAAVPGAPAPGRVGNRIVAVGLGGKLILTVSFFGWTFAGSGGLGAPGGTLGLSSAINLF
jgi:hypothetical protein